MSYQGINFANQRLVPSDDGRLYQKIFNDGALYGCELSYSGAVLFLTPGFLIIGGREIELDAAEQIPINEAISGFAQLVISIDLTQTATKDSFNQISMSVRYAAAEDGFATLVQDDINGSGSRYEAQLALVSLGAGGITGIIEDMPQAAFRGAADGLNHKVVGGTEQPISPAENTVWVNTDTAINGYAFSADEPASPVEGMIWFETGVDAPAPINIDKKNTVMLYPTGCKQYISGAWVKKQATTYQNGAWVDWVTYLYNTGDERTAITGGWKGVNNYSGEGYTKGTLTKNTSSITLATAASLPSAITAQTTKKISLSGFSELKINVTNFTCDASGGAWIGIFSANAAQPVAELSITSKGTKSLDISEYSSGTYYVEVECYAESTASKACTLTFDRIWLE